MSEAKLHLETPTYRTDELMQRTPDGTALRSILCQVKTVTQTEWTNAAKLGLKASWCVSVWADEYRGEEKAVLDGISYTIYRTFRKSESDRMELYLGRKVGV